MIKEIYDQLLLRQGNRDGIDNDEIYAVCRNKDTGVVMPYSQIHSLFLNDRTRVRKGHYDMRLVTFNADSLPPPDDAADAAVADEVEELQRQEEVEETDMTPNTPAGITYIPDEDPAYVPWGNSKEVRSIIESKLFFPTYIPGESGNGKTIMVEQTCAKLRREFIRVQISPDTDEDDLLGGFQLKNGETFFVKGPVLVAMERGAVLCIDEIDRGTNKIMCLQGVLEGKPVLIKKTGEIVKPKKGFTAFATANTKGAGSDTGRYSAAQVIDDALLERFVCTLEQGYAPPAIEKSIVLRHMKKLRCEDSDFTDCLVAWANSTRQTMEQGGVDTCISTRRLCHIVTSFAVFRDRLKAVVMCIGKFDPETKEAFSQLYQKIDKNANRPAVPPLSSIAAKAGDGNKTNWKKGTF